MIKIKSGVKLPPSGSGRPSKYPFAKMKVGQMFEFPKGIKRNTATANVASARRRLKMKFAVRVLGNGAFGCWRVK